MRIFIAFLFLALAFPLFSFDKSQFRLYESFDDLLFRVAKNGRVLMKRRGINLPILSGYIASTTTAALLTFTSTADPNLTANSASGSLAVRFLDGEIAPLALSFIVPNDFDVAGSIIIIASATESNVSTATFLKVEVILDNGEKTTLSDVTVSNSGFSFVLADYSSMTIVGSNTLDLLISRNDTTSGTGTLDVSNVYFLYNPSISRDEP